MEPKPRWDPEPPPPPVEEEPPGPPKMGRLIAMARPGVLIDERGKFWRWNDGAWAHVENPGEVSGTWIK